MNPEETVMNEVSFRDSAGDVLAITYEDGTDGIDFSIRRRIDGAESNVYLHRIQLEGLGAALVAMLEEIDK